VVVGEEHRDLGGFGHVTILRVPSDEGDSDPVPFGPPCEQCVEHRDADNSAS
jgi:hypothetical protein